MPAKDGPNFVLGAETDNLGSLRSLSFLADFAFAVSFLAES